MAKGYWVCTGTIHTPLGMVPYISAFTSWLEAVGARLLVRDLFSDVREGEPGTVNVIVEFESREAAVAALEAVRPRLAVPAQAVLYVSPLGWRPGSPRLARRALVTLRSSTRP